MLAAYILAFRLYLPDRYAYLSVELLYRMAIAMLACTLLFSLAKFAGRLVSPLRPALPLIILGLGWFVFVTHSADEFALNGDPEPEISAYLRTTPKDTIVAGFEEYLDSVPAHGLRSTYAAIELILPYKTRYFGLMRERTFRMRDAFATSSSQELSAFARRENIDLLVLPHGDLQISRRWKRSFPSLAILDGLHVPMGTTPDGTECVVSFGRNANLVDANCLGGQS